MGRDQMENALRIQHHHLGKIIHVEKIQTSHMLQTILEVSNDSEIAENITQMSTIFKQQNTQKTALQFIEKHLKNIVKTTPENV